MDSDNDNLEKEKQLLRSVADKGAGEKAKTYVRLCGPGWLQGAITLGGGSLVGALGLGVIGGTSFMWVQPVAMILGIIMLSAIAYVTLSTGERPLKAINEHVSPVLGWGWLIATMLANMIWCLPQFNLAFGAVTSNLAPGAPVNLTSKIVISGIILGVATFVIWSYGTGSRGVKHFENILKAMVGLIVLSFIAVVVALTFGKDSPLEWGAVFAGLIPDLSALFKPAPAFQEAINQLDVDSAKVWTKKIASLQRDTIITAVGTSVGINMTFLLPYSMLRRGWAREHRGLSIFDLSTGLFIPFVIATGCLVIAAATQFHANPDNYNYASSASLVDGVKMELGAAPYAELETKGEAGLAKGMKDFYNSLKTKKKDKLKIDDSNYAGNADFVAAFKIQLGEAPYEKIAKAEDKGLLKRTLIAFRDALDKEKMAVTTLEMMTAKRSQLELANSLKPFTGKVVSQYLFGLGVLAMAISTIVILMLINGFAFCEMLGVETGGKSFRIGCLIAGGVGFFGPIAWGPLGPWLALPTSVAGFSMLPIAYFAFFFLMNSKSLLGDDMPTGARRVKWNTLMAIAASMAALGSAWASFGKIGWWGPGLIVAFGVATAATWRGGRKS